MRKLVNPARIAVILLFLALVSTVYVVALYDLQVVNGERWSEYAENNRLISSTVEASRGSILARNGNTLVSNRAVNNITLDYTALYQDEEPMNSIILRLVTLADSMDYEHNDTLPLTGSPFAYLDEQEMTDTQRIHLESYIEHYQKDILAFLKTDEEDETEAEPEETAEPEEPEIYFPTAVELMAFMRDHYRTDAGYTAEETRAVIGIRYELDLRVNNIVGLDQYAFVDDVDIDLITAIKEGSFPGVEVQESSVRRYNTTVASHILGRVGLMDAEDWEIYQDVLTYDAASDEMRRAYTMNAYVGKEGIELEYEEFLHGVNGTKTVTVTSAGTVINERADREADPGGNVVTTLDSGLQRVSESALESLAQSINAGRGYNEEQVTGGAAIAIDPNNGEVLAMASFPTFNLETEDYNSLLADTERRPLFNRATQGTYTPGSTFKMVTAIAALDQGLVTEYETIYCDGAFREYSNVGFTLKCMGNHGHISLRDALSKSCNTYFSTLANRLGVSLLAEYTERLGLGVETGMGFNEATGLLATEENMQAINGGMLYAADYVMAGIGQSISLFTPIQLANYVATVANGGTRYQPHLLKEVLSYDSSEVLYTYEPEILSTVDIAPSVYEALRDGMVMASSDGTAAKYFSNFEVRVASKTGTAETNKAYEDGVFVCYAPADNPQIAIAVVVEKAGAGSDVIPVAKAMLEYYFASDEITQDITPENTLLP